MPDDLVLVADHGRVRTLTLDRPQAFNSFTTQMHGALRAALQAVARAASMRCVVMTGPGRAFGAGQALSDPAIAPDLTPGATAKAIGRLLDDHYIPLARRLRSMRVPVIAAVNGVAAGAGANFALNCDTVVAARTASFIQPFSRIGLIPDRGGTWFLPRLVGRARAIALSMTGDKLSAEVAARVGLIWACVDKSAFADIVRALGQRLASIPTRGLAESRRAIDSAIELGSAAAPANESRVQSKLGRAHVHVEGAAAFVQERAPSFSDR